MPAIVESLIASLADAGRRVDTLSLEWGSLAPYIQCAPDQPCGSDWGTARETFLASAPGLGQLDPYILCNPEDASCTGVDAPSLVCRDWGTGFVDPVPRY